MVLFFDASGLAKRYFEEIGSNTVNALFAASPPPADFVLVASDKRRLRAAEAEGIRTFNPEELAAADVPAFLAAL